MRITHANWLAFNIILIMLFFLKFSLSPSFKWIVFRWLKKTPLVIFYLILRALHRKIVTIWKMQNQNIWLVVNQNLTNEIGPFLNPDFDWVLVSRVIYIIQIVMICQLRALNPYDIIHNSDNLQWNFFENSFKIKIIIIREKHNFCIRRQ